MSSAIKLNQRIVRIFSVLGLMAALTMFLLPAHGAAAQGSGGGTVNIHVADLDSGANISGAGIVIISDQTNWADKVETDAFGYANLAVPVGTYRIKVSATGYVEIKAYTEVKIGVESKVGILMRSPSHVVPPGMTDRRNIPGAGTLQVHTTDSNKTAALSGAAVAVYSANEPVEVGKGVTDKQGDFT